MSLKEWKEKYYPVAAEEIANTKGVGPIKLIKHSLRKWEGLRELDKYKLAKKGKGFICSETREIFFVDDKSCSLCREYYSIFNVNECSKCPIFKYQKRKCSDEFEIWVFIDYPEPMIKLLEQTLEFYKEKNRERQAKKLSRKSRA